MSGRPVPIAGAENVTGGAVEPLPAMRLPSSASGVVRESSHTTSYSLPDAVMCGNVSFNADVDTPHVIPTGPVADVSAADTFGTVLAPPEMSCDSHTTAN
jgi:hypothetical protein